MYEVPCMDCSRSYIGETGRTLQKRLVEHKAAVRRGDTNNGIAVHAWEHQHRVDWENASVLKQEPGYWKRRVLEAIEIQRHAENTNWIDYLDSVSGMTCVINMLSTISVFVIPSLSHRIIIPSHHYHITSCLPIYPCHNRHVTIYSCVSVLIVITAEECPWTETESLLLTCYDKLNKLSS